MKREIYKDLLRWKDSVSRKPLILYGARQVGKTYILKEFGKREFQNMVYLNCYKNTAIQNIFRQDVNIKRILNELSVYSGVDIKPHSTFLFLDEVQEIPEVVASLKYFCEDAPEIFIAVAGSLLGVMEMEGISFPTGKVNILDMFPMTFKEFLTAMGKEKQAQLLSDSESRGGINSMAAIYIELLRQYYFVGGMPEAVKEFRDTGNTDKVRQIQNEILTAYQADIAKHAGRDALKARMVLQSIPQQLARENKKFIYGAVRKGARASEFENAIQWLCDARIIYKVCRTRKIGMPLNFYLEKDVFKLYLLDVGLLGAMVMAPASKVLIGDNIFTEYKGAFTENYVLNQLITIPNTVISYYAKDNSTVELDFLVQLGDSLIPVEVKAEENVKSKSLRQIITVDQKESNLKGVRFSMRGFEDQQWMENIPLFAVGSIAGQ